MGEFKSKNGRNTLIREKFEQKFPYERVSTHSDGLNAFIRENLNENSRMNRFQPFKSTMIDVDRFV